MNTLLLPTRVRSLRGLCLGLGILLASSSFASERSPLDAARQIIDAVNAQDAAKYAAVFADDAKIKRHGEAEILLAGRALIEDNRRQHFERFPNIRAEIQHLVQIGSKVVMHDRVWLDGKTGESVEIVEIFEFEDGLVTQMEVLQAPNIVRQDTNPTEDSP